MLRARVDGKMQTAIEAIVERGAGAFADAWSYIPTNSNKEFWEELCEELKALDVEMHGVRFENKGLRGVERDNQVLRTELDVARGDAKNAKEILANQRKHWGQEIDNMRGVNVSLQREIALMQEQVAENATLKFKVDQLKQAVASYASDCDSFSKANEKLEAAYAGHQDELASVRLRRVELEREVKTLTGTNIKLNGEIAGTRQRYDEIVQRNREQDGQIQAQFETIKRMELDRDRVQVELDKLRKENARLTRHTIDQSKRVEALQGVSRRLQLQERHASNLQTTLTQLEAAYKGLDGMYKDVCKRLASGSSSGETLWSIPVYNPDCGTFRSPREEKSHAVSADIEAAKLAARQQAERVQQVQTEGEEGLKHILNKVALYECLSSVQQLALWNHYRLNSIESQNTSLEWEFTDGN